MSYRTILENEQKRLNQQQKKLDLESSQQFDLFRGLPFYNWDKPKNHLQDTFVGKIGLPVKNRIEHPLCDYERYIIQYLETDNPGNIKNKHLYILKSSALGITTYCCITLVGSAQRIMHGREAEYLYSQLLDQALWY